MKYLTKATVTLSKWVKETFVRDSKAPVPFSVHNAFEFFFFLLMLYCALVGKIKENIVFKTFKEPIAIVFLFFHVTILIHYQ